MKKFLVLLMTAAMLIVTGCGDDANTNSNNTA